MVAAIRQTVTVGPDGRIEIRSSQLQPGTKAEVIILPESSQVSQPLILLTELQNSLKLDDAAAQAWARQARDERNSSVRPPGLKAG
jgi:hypothetical protein